MTGTDLKHLLNRVVFGLEQLAPGRQVAVGQDAAGFQQPVSVTLQKNAHFNKSISPSSPLGHDLKKTRPVWCVYHMKDYVMLLLLYAVCICALGAAQTTD